MADLVTGDTGSKLKVTCLDSGTNLPVNLSGSTVRLRWEGEAGVVTKVMSITDATNGKVEYQFLANDIIAPKMRFEVEITDAGGFVVSNLELIELEVREQLG